MPAARRTSLPEIVAAASQLLESDGIDGLTMQAVASRVGVRAPSLYKHVTDRAALIRLVATDAALALAAALQADAAMSGPDTPDAARRGIRRMADALRAFAHQRPEAFVLVFRPASEAWRVPDEDNRRSAAPILSAAQRLAGPEHALDAARALTALCWGFVSMELAGAFRLGGDVESAWSFAVDGMIDAIAAPVA